MVRAEQATTFLVTASLNLESIEYNYWKVKCFHVMCVLTFHYVCLCNLCGCLTAEFFPAPSEGPCRKGTQHSWRRVEWTSDTTNKSCRIYRGRKKPALVWRITFICLQGNHITYFILISEAFVSLITFKSPRNKIILHALSYVSNRVIVAIPEKWQILTCLYFWVCRVVPSWKI